jgi:hypothetical protein
MTAKVRRETFDVRGSTGDVSEYRLARTKEQAA